MNNRYYPPGWWIFPRFVAGGLLWALAILGLVCLFSGPTEAQPCDVPPGATELLTSPSSPHGGESDQLVLAPHPEATAALCYYNHINQVTADGDYTLTMGGLTVHVRVEFTDLDEERVVVTPPPGHWVLPDVIGYAQDGQSVTLLIIMGVS